MRISDWSSDVCSSDLSTQARQVDDPLPHLAPHHQQQHGDRRRRRTDDAYRSGRRPDDMTDIAPQPDRNQADIKRKGGLSLIAPFDARQNTTQKDPQRARRHSTATLMPPPARTHVAPTSPRCTTSGTNGADTCRQQRPAPTTEQNDTHK